MSYNISLIDPVSREELELDSPHFMRGGTYAVGGTTKACLNITYNYADQFRKVFPEEGIRVLYGMTGADSIPVLQSAINKLGNDIDEDYWKSTEGNAKRALTQLLALAKIRPDGVWDGD